MSAPYLRPHPLRVPGVETLEDASRWLESQNEAVRAVTRLFGNGRLVQSPVVDPGSVVDPTAVLIGGIIVERGCYIGPHAVVRLDERENPMPCIIGEQTNIQDCAIVHANTPSIGRRVIVAHQAIVHGATIKDDVSLYIQAVVDSNTILGPGCFLHQGSYVGKNLVLAPNRYVAPGQKVLTQKEAEALPEVPEPLLAIRASVLEDNAKHVKNHRLMLV